MHAIAGRQFIAFLCSGAECLVDCSIGLIVLPIPWSARENWSVVNTEPGFAFRTNIICTT